MPEDKQQTPVVKVELKRLALNDFVKTDDLLAKSPLLEHLDQRGREVLLANGTTRRFAVRAPVYTQGSEGDSLFLVLRGEIGLTSGKDAIEVGAVRRGEYFGEAEALKPGRRQCNAVATIEADVAEFPRTLLVKLFERYPLFEASLRETSQARTQADSELTDFLNRW
jgi:CRP-like cAMP-binding protein